MAGLCWSRAPGTLLCICTTWGPGKQCHCESLLGSKILNCWNVFCHTDAANHMLHLEPTESDRMWTFQEEHKA